MLKSLETALRLSEIREKLNALNAVQAPTDEQQTEERDLLASQKTTEVEYREALTDEGDEHAPVRRLTPKRASGCSWSLGQVVGAHLRARLSSIAASDGAESEIQAASRA